MNKKAFIFAGIVIASIAAAAQQGVTLRRELKEDTSDVYKVQFDMKSTGNAAGTDFDLSINSSLKLTVKAGKKEATGALNVDAIATDVQAKVDGSAAVYVEPMIDSLPKEIKASGTLTDHNKLTMKDAKSSMAAMMSHVSPAQLFNFIEFPDKAVNVGDTWNILIEKNPFYGKKTQTLTAKLEGEKDLDGAKVWVVSVTGKLNIDADLAALAGDEAPAGAGTMKGTSDMTGEALVDKATGKTLLYTVTTKDDTTMEGQVTVETKATTKTVSTLQK